MKLGITIDNSAYSYKILRYLFFNGLNNINISQISKNLNMTQSQLTKKLKELYNYNLLFKEYTSSKRQVIYKVTDKGKKLISESLKLEHVFEELERENEQKRKEGLVK